MIKVAINNTESIRNKYMQRSIKARQKSKISDDKLEAAMWRQVADLYSHLAICEKNHQHNATPENRCNWINGINENGENDGDQ